jgi:tRNA nucleotidyltransferase (CCA-adding enzyme)
MTINAGVKHICSELIHNGHQAFIVGGAVRDSFLGKVPKDFDIVSDATPENIKKIFKNYNVLEMGISFGIVTVICNNTPYEIAQMRTDGDYTDGRRPNGIQPINEIELDLARRDFTINSLAYHPLNRIVTDPFSGVIDIHNKIINFVGNPSERIREDKLRILRAFRFMSQLNFTFSKETYNAIFDHFIHGGTFVGVSQERITEEFSKILLGQNATQTIKLMMEMNILPLIIPELKELLEPHDNEYHSEIFPPFGNSIFSHILYVLLAAEVRTNEKNLELMLAALLHDIAKPRCRGKKANGKSNFHKHDLFGSELVKDILTRMKYSNNIIANVSELTRQHMNIHNLAGKMNKVYKIKRLISNPNFSNMFLLGICDTLGTAGNNGVPNQIEADVLINQIENYIKLYGTTLEPPLITGNDLIEAEFKPGPIFSEVLYKTHNYQLNGETNKDKLLRYAKGLFNYAQSKIIDED